MTARFRALEVRGEWLQWDASLLAYVQNAARENVRLIWRGKRDALPSAEVANLFTSGLLTSTPQDALEFLRTPPPPEECAFLLERQMFRRPAQPNHAALLL